jgi:hypothetical protein
VSPLSVGPSCCATPKRRKAHVVGGRCLCELSLSDDAGRGPGRRLSRRALVARERLSAVVAARIDARRRQFAHGLPIRDYLDVHGTSMTLRHGFCSRARTENRHNVLAATGVTMRRDDEASTEKAPSRRAPRKRAT